MNIPSMLMSLLSTSGAGKSISSATGIPREKADSAISAAVPSLLAAFTNVASTEQGAQQLATAASQQDAGMLDNLDGALSSKGSRIADQGSTMLGSLLGGQSTMMNSILSRFTGVGEGAMGKIIGMLAPIILAFLGKQSGGRGASGIASLLSSQKEHIQSAMPSGLSSLLSGSLPGIGNLLGSRTAYDRVQEPTRYADAPSSTEWERRPSERPRGGSPLRWALPVAILLALLAIPLFMRRDRQPTPTVTDDTPAVRQPAAGINAPPSVGAPAGTATGSAAGANLATEGSTLIREATTALGTIRDSASAQEAIPTLENINQRFSNLKNSWSSMPEPARNTVQNTLSPLATRLESSAQSILSNPGTDAVHPQVRELVNNVKTFSQQGQSGRLPPE